MSEFSCKGKRLADYLINHGAKLIRIEKGNIYIFEKDDSIYDKLANYEKDTKKCMF
jgi:hypothetical protein